MRLVVRRLLGGIAILAMFGVSAILGTSAARAQDTGQAKDVAGNESTVFDMFETVHAKMGPVLYGNAGEYDRLTVQYTDDAPSVTCGGILLTPANYESDSITLQAEEGIDRCGRIYVDDDGHLVVQVSNLDGTNSAKYVVNTVMSTTKMLACVCFRNSAVACTAADCERNVACVTTPGGEERAWCENRGGRQTKKRSRGHQRFGQRLQPRWLESGNRQLQRPVLLI